MSLYIGVYTVLYEYEAQTEEELSVGPNDILYLLERSDVDDWWKVKKRILPVGDEEVDEPVGLVPSNYIEQAPVVKTCTALYDYTKQTEEELSFVEGDGFNIYDLNDPDWLLVGDAASGQLYGFIPSNYVQMGDAQPQAASTTPITNFAPPPQHISRQASQEPAVSAPPPVEKEEVPQNLDDDYEEPEPSLPSRPRPTQAQAASQNYEDDAPPPSMPTRPRTDSEARWTEEEEEEDLEAPIQEHSFDGEFFKWFIDEIDGRKKRPVILAIGKGMIVLKPNSSSPRKIIKRTASTLDNEWRIKDLTTFSNEKKHVFLELKNPTASIELHCGTKDVADAVMSILGDLKGAETQRGLKEVERASRPSNNGSNKKIGRLIYDFKAQGDDELNCRESDEVYIINSSKSPDWWMCENIDTGKQGVVPSSYIEIIGSSNLDKLTDTPSRQKSKRSKSEDKKKAKSSRHRDRDERDKIREKDRMEREKANTERSASSDKAMPNFHRVRTWIDSSGSFKVEAEFLGCIEGKIHLHKTNGVKIAVGATKLSMEDLEYVEKVTGTSLESYKEEVVKQNAKRKAALDKKNGVKSQEKTAISKPKSAMASINDIAPPQPTRPKSSSTTQVSEPEYDWFDFFLSCGVDVGNCQRYTLNFGREQMDENILEDITPSLLRTLGLREGDIIRVMKFLDTKYDRTKAEEAAPSAPSGGLFTQATGALKNNSSSEISKVDANALPTPNQSQQPTQAQAAAEQKKFEDDAWAIKPAARSNEDLSKPSAPVQPQYTGSLQDLVNIKPIDSATSTGNSYVNKPMPALPVDAGGKAPSAPALTPVKTGTLVQPGQQFAVQKTGAGNLVSPQKTGTLVPVQRTGGFVPVQMTGGLISAQPTGFIPIASQPTGFMPIQATGGLVPVTTGGFVPLQTGATAFTGQVPQITGQMPQQITGGLPPVTFGQATLQTGNVTMPATSFGQQPVFTQVTGQMPPTSFGQPMSLQATGPLVPAQRTGQGQMTGGAMPPTSFGQPFQPQSTFGQQITGGSMYQPPPQQQQQPQQPSFAQNTFNQQSMFNQPSFGQQSFAPQPQPSFGQQPFQNFAQQTGFAMPPQTTFGQPQQFDNNMGQMTNMFQNTSISSPPTFNQQFPNTTFGQPQQPQPQQPQFEGFGGAPLQSQPTGSGFGNAPLQAQATGRRANLSAATPDNPFGF